MATYNDYVTQAYANPNVTSAVGSNGIADAYGSAFGSPERYKYYQDQLKQYMAANPYQGEIANYGGNPLDNTGDPAKMAEAQWVQDGYQKWLSTLNPSQKAEYTKVVDSNFSKGQSNGRGAMAAAMAAMTLGGSLAAEAAMPSFAGNAAGLVGGAGSSIASNAGALAANAVNAGAGGAASAFDALTAPGASLWGAAPSVGGASLAGDASLLTGGLGAGLGTSEALGGLGAAAGGLSYARPSIGSLTQGMTPASIAASEAALPAGTTAATGGLLGDLAKNLGVDPNTLLKAGGGLLGAALGAIPGANSATQSTQNKIDPRIVPYIYGSDGKSGLMGQVNALQQQQSAQGGLNDTQKQGLAMQQAAYLDPKYTAGFDQMRSQGANLMNAPVAGNPFSTGQSSLAPAYQPPQQNQMRTIGRPPTRNLGF